MNLSWKQVIIYGTKLKLRAFLQINPFINIMDSRESKFDNEMKVQIHLLSLGVAKIRKLVFSLSS